MSRLKYFSTIAGIVTALLLGNYGVSESMPGQPTTPSNYGKVIQGLKIEGDYSLFGSKFDGVTLTNSTITGALKIDGVKNVTIKDNHLNNIWFRGNQPTDHVVIEHNDISGAPEDCIHIHDGSSPAQDVVIRNNNIHSCGVAHPTSGLYHAIYDQVPGVKIIGNCVSDARSAISVRSSATIEKNRIERVNSGGAIEYFSDHDAPPGAGLVIKGNVISTVLKNEPANQGSNRGLIVLGNDIGKNKRPVSYFDIQDNQLAVLNKQNDSDGRYFNIYNGQSKTKDIRLENNFMVRLNPSGPFTSPDLASASATDRKTRAEQSALAITASQPPPCR